MPKSATIGIAVALAAVMPSAVGARQVAISARPPLSKVRVAVSSTDFVIAAGSEIASASARRLIVPLGRALRIDRDAFAGMTRGLPSVRP